MRFRTALFAPVFLLVPLALPASSPIIGVDRDPPNPTPVTSTSFGFGADNAGGGDLSFQNETGQGWTELTVLTNLPAVIPSPTCFAGPFVTCNVAGSVGGANVAYTILFGPKTSGVAIPQGEIFSINLNDSGTNPVGGGSWPAGQDFSAQANSSSTPEPAAGWLTLAGAGLAGLLLRYRRASAG